MPVPGPLELGLILLIVAMLFGVGKLPEVFGAVGKGIREFKREASLDDLGESKSSDDANSTNTKSTTDTVDTADTAQQS